MLSHVPVDDSWFLHIGQLNVSDVIGIITITFTYSLQNVSSILYNAVLIYAFVIRDGIFS
jgi:hypothetical protein